MLRPRHREALAADLSLAALIIIGCLVLWGGAGVAGDASKEGAAAPQPELQLEVWINGHSSNLIAPFVELPGGVLAVSRDALVDLDLSVPAAAGTADRVRLDAIAGLSYRFDKAAQTVHLTVGKGLRKPKVYDARAEPAPIDVARADYGALINYSLYGSAAQSLSSRSPTRDYGGFNGVNATLDGRLIMPFGNLTMSGLVGTIPTYTSPLANPLTDANARRYETAFTHVDPNTFMTYRVGDTINGSLAWTQPVRMGGIQVQRNFSSRPDIVTQALPSYSGTAAAPSSVDVFVNGVKSYSQQVAAGPFQLSNIPTFGSGEARVVVRDASGKEVETRTPFYTAPSLLRPGLYEASAEAGLARYNFGISSNDYGTSPIGSVSLRAGITDWFTAEAHGEGGLGVANGGVGGVVNVGNRAVISGAVTGSLQDGKAGVQLYGSLDTRIGPVGVRAQTRRAVGDYVDLAVATSRLRPSTADEEARAAASGGVTSFFAGYRPAVSRDQVSVSLPIAYDRSSLSATYVRSEADTGRVSQIVALSYSRPFIAKSMLFATAFGDLDQLDKAGAYVGVTMPLGETSVSASVNTSKAGSTASVDAAKPLSSEPGEWGYRVRDSEGELSSRGGAISYRTEKARLEATVYQNGQGVRESIEATGSVVAMGGNVYMANTINDGFAVVNAGAPGVRVLSENRFVGETDADGTILVPNLRSHQKNTLAIDPTNLSISAEVDQPYQEVVPAYRSGVTVDFKVRREGASAIVIFKQADGRFIEPGSHGRTEGGAAFIVGYDGQAFIKDLAASNTAIITLGAGECHAAFNFKAQADTQVVVGPVVCE